MQFEEASPRTADGVYLVAAKTGGPSRLAQLVRRSFERLLTKMEVIEAERCIKSASESAELCESDCGSAAIGDTTLCRRHCFQAIYRES